VICIADANIWIDLQVGALLDAPFATGDTWVTPDIILLELGEDAQQLIDRGLEQRTLTGDELEHVVTLAETYPRPSEADLAALLLADLEGSILVTGDAALREAAQKEGVEVHGTLWILDRLVAEEIITTGQAAQGLRLMVEHDRRLPEREVNRRLARWE